MGVTRWRGGIDLLCMSYESFVWFFYFGCDELYMWSRCAFDDVKISKGEKGGYSRLESV